MAKRRKEKDEEADKPFKLPKFDEEAFLKRETRNIKSTFISFLFGCFMALICFGFWALMGDHDLRWGLVLLVGLVNAAFLKYIFLRINIDLTDFGRKNWFGSYAIYFFTWLIVFIIIVNPPFYDNESPRIDIAVLPGMQEYGGTVKILAKITDNSGVEKQDITFTIDGNKVPSENFEFIDDIFGYTYPSPTNLTGEEPHSFKLTVKDTSGHTTEVKDTFSFSNDTIYLALPDPGSNVETATDIKFWVGTDVDRVYYTIDDKEINTTKSDRENYYVTNPEYQGWQRNEDVTLNISAEIIYYFENHIVNGEFVKFNNTIVDTDIYNFSVADESTIGLKPSEKIKIPGPRLVMAPGFETIIFLISLILAVLIFKKRKKNRRKQK